MGTPPPGAEIIEDLGTVVEDGPTWRRRWLLPIAGVAVLAVVLTVLFVKVPTIRPAALGGPAPATAAFRPLALPPGTGTLVSRVAFSGVTGLGGVSESEGFRLTYRLPDGRILTFFAYPVRTGADRLERVVPPAGFAVRPASVRGVPALIELGTDSAGTTSVSILVWIADGTYYQLSTSASDLEELQRFAAELR